MYYLNGYKTEAELLPYIIVKCMSDSVNKALVLIKYSLVVVTTDNIESITIGPTRQGQTKEINQIKKVQLITCY